MKYIYDRELVSQVGGVVHILLFDEVVPTPESRVLILDFDDDEGCVYTYRASVLSLFERYQLVHKEFSERFEWDGCKIVTEVPTTWKGVDYLRNEIEYWTMGLENDHPLILQFNRSNDMQHYLTMCRKAQQPN